MYNTIESGPKKAVAHKVSYNFLTSVGSGKTKL